MDITYHMVPKSYFESLDPSADYLPAEFGKDGFIHCTDGEYIVSAIAFNIFRHLDDELLILFIDKEMVISNIRYDDPDKLFPHIYGPLNRNAIRKTSQMIRDRKGDWIFPIHEAIR
jgi:uncharacterized protein (DUF952 family)